MVDKTKTHGHVRFFFNGFMCTYRMTGRRMLFAGECKERQSVGIQQGGEENKNKIHRMQTLEHKQRVFPGIQQGGEETRTRFTECRHFNTSTAATHPFRTRPPLPESHNKMFSVE